MARKTKFITSVLALLTGFFIFGASLLMASQVRPNNGMRVSDRKFYIGDRILPDHVLYPVLMVADKIILETSFGERKIRIKMKLADDRLISSMILIQKGQEELAMSTITKSQKYLISASGDFFDNNSRSESLKNDLLNSIKRNSSELEKCKNEFEVVNTMPIDDLLNESSVLINQLKST